MPSILKFLILLPLLIAPAGVRAGPTVEHDLDVLVDPPRGTLAVSDRLTLPDAAMDWTFTLHRDLTPRVVEGNAKLERIGTEAHLERFRLEPKGPGPIRLRYGGRIQHGLEDLREGMGRRRQRTRGTIGEDGVVLDGFSGWYPRFGDSLNRFSLSVRLPAGWLAVSQGEGPEISETADQVRIGWREIQPQDDIYLVAAPFERFARATPFGEAQVYLRDPDEDLASRYLDATGEYLALYSDLIGPYPYAKFALVENFWETGYGMPSFTLLGPRVIRLPFIIHTSYPHEVLHNWWGNGVYVDYRSGNWSEGLTAYLADHLLKERRGQGAEYRRDTLKSYADYVRDANDFALHDFRGRHGSASQAIGYGKTLMLFHMLRRDLGDEDFVAGLRRFYRDNRFKAAGFDDLRISFEQESGKKLDAFFRQWTERTGAPELTLSDVSSEETPDGYRLSGRIAQVQREDPFSLRVPLLVHLQGRDPVEHRVTLTQRSARFELELPAKPLRAAVDPGFDLFRRLVPGESPATLSNLFGAERGLIVLPAGAPDELAEGYRELAAAWNRGSGEWQVLKDRDLATLPEDRPVWLLGWGNRLLPVLATGAEGLDPEPMSQGLKLQDETYVGGGQSVALVRRVRGHTIGWVATGTPDALPGLARKLPHYGKYSYLVFDGQAPENRIKGLWPVDDSRLSVWLTDERPVLQTAPSLPLTARVH